MIVPAKRDSTNTALPKAEYVIHYHVNAPVSERSVTAMKSLTAMDGSCVKYWS